MKKLFQIGFMLCALLFSAKGLLGQTEYDIKAAYLYNFAKFVDWPEGTFEHEDAPLIIGIIGTDPFHQLLNEAISGKTTKGRRLVVRRFKRIAEVTLCHILFIARSERRNLSKILAQTKGSGILTVSELDDFIDEGGIVRLFTKGNKVRFDINLAVAQQSRLKISSRVLNLAENLKLQTNGKE